MHDSESESIFVALDCICCCYNEMSDKVWMGHGVKAKMSSKSNASLPETHASTTPTYQGSIV